MGISYDDFCRLDTVEFAEAYNAYTSQRNFDLRDNWERMRILATVMLQPHLDEGARITPQQLIPLPWDAEGMQEEKHLRTAAEQRARTAELEKRVKKFNEKTDKEHGRK